MRIIELTLGVSVCRSDGHGGIQGARHRPAGAEEDPQPHGQQERGQSLHRRHHRQPPRQRLQARKILREYFSTLEFVGSRSYEKKRLFTFLL